MWAPDQWKVKKGKNSDSPFTVQYYRRMLANTRQSWILDPIPWIQDSGCRIPVFSSGTSISRFHSLVGTILDSKALDSGFHIKIFPDSGSYEQKFSRFRNPDTLTCGEVLVKIFWPVHAYLIKEWEIYFSSNVRFYNMMDQSNFWSMQLFQTGPHFKPEEFWCWKGIFSVLT